MKLVNYELQNQMEGLAKASSLEFFTNYVRSIVEDTSKPYHNRTDYLGLSLNELSLKIGALAEGIRELQQLKKYLELSLGSSKEIIAAVFLENGIDRMDGNIVSSLTLSQASTKTKTSFSVIDAQAVMQLGYVRFEPDLESIEQALVTQDGLDALDKYVSFTSETITVPAKVKVNLRRTAANTQADALIELVDAA